jgi:3-oxoacyl-[acyl-carrier protein] reductase
MDLGLAGKAVLVTAASEGLGLACAERFAREGCRVAIAARRPTPLQAAEAALRAAGSPDVCALQADLVGPEQAEALPGRAAERLGGLEILVVNSGHVAYGGLADLSDAAWNEAFNLLLMSAIRLARGAVPLMRAAGGGDIVFLGSASIRRAPPHLLASTIMRLGVAGLAKTLARDLAPENIRVNLVAPGYFDTGRVRRRIDALVAEEGMDRAAAALRIAGDLPQRRIGDPAELADVVAFVASRRSAFLAGEVIAVDGAATDAPL